MSIANNIKNLRQSHKLNQAEFGKIAGVTDKAVSSWENGTKDPRMGHIQKIADYFGICKSDIIEDYPLTADEHRLVDYYRNFNAAGKSKLLNEATDMSLLEKYKSNNSIQLLDKEPTIQIKHSVYKVSAGPGFPLGEGDDWGEPIEVPDTPQTRKADFAITIDGDSMEPKFHSGDIILVKKQDSIDIGEIGVFRLDKEMGYLKKYGGDRLISLNDDYDDIMLAEYPDSACIGKVIGTV